MNNPKTSNQGTIVDPLEQEKYGAERQVPIMVRETQNLDTKIKQCFDLTDNIFSALGRLHEGEEAIPVEEYPDMDVIKNRVPNNHMEALQIFNENMNLILRDLNTINRKLDLLI